jgi:ribonuclease Z
MELIILGSSAAIPLKNRNLPSIALKYRNEVILFDGGEDLQRRIIDAGLKLNKKMKILISHFHGDHVIGLPGLLFRFNLIERSAPLTIFGPRNIFAYLYMHRTILGLKANYPLTIIEIDNDNKKLIEYDGLDSQHAIQETQIIDTIINETKRYFLKYTLVEHSIPTFAFCFEEKPRPGKFNPERARQLGIPESSLWKKLHEGQTIEFKDKAINPSIEGIVGPPRKGRKITYSGDTGPSKALIKLGRNSNVLIHEATFSKQLENVAREKQHSTSVDAALVAREMNTQLLILTHLSSRYQEDSNNLLNDAKEIFPNTILAHDLLRVEIK